MWWQILGKPGIKKLSRNVSWALKSQFVIEPEVLAKLRCLEKGGKMGGASVRYLRIIDPALVPATAKGLSYTDLESYRAALLFEGHAGTDGFGGWYANFRQSGAVPRFVAVPR